MRKILFITATHGNERDGVKVMSQIEKELPKNEYGYDWIIGNENAYAQNVRYVEKDLNRSAPGDINSTVYEIRRAAEIIELSKNFDIVIDLHGTKTDNGIATIIPYPTKENVALANLMGLEHNVVWYAEESKIAGPLVQHAHVPAIELECGPKNTPKAFELTYAAVRIFIENIFNEVDTVQIEKKFYNVYGKLAGAHNPTLRDFMLTCINEEEFYPFLSGNEYPDVACYKMKKVAASQISLI